MFFRTRMDHVSVMCEPKHPPVHLSYRSNKLNDIKKTPTEQAGIMLDLEQNKIENLIIT